LIERKETEMLLPGDPAPYFVVSSNVNPRFNFDTTAGRYIVLSFFASSAHPFARSMLDELERRREAFDTNNLIFFGVSIDPEDKQRLAHQNWPGFRFFWDFDFQVSRKYGAMPDGEAPTSPGAIPGDGSDRLFDAPSPSKMEYYPHTVVLDQAMRVIAVLSFAGEPADHVNQIIETIDSHPKLSDLQTRAPVLIVPYVFEPELCQRLIEYYHSHDAEDSGFMRDVDGKTVGVLDYSHKRRMDCEISDEDLIHTTQERIKRRIVPAIRQAYQFHATRIERHIVACYDAAQGAHFRAHRDNTTMGTAHRRFAITINLNSPEYEGGEIWFPEFGQQLYKAPSGAAIVFSCSLLHEVPRVTKGKRYAFLPFLYDDAAAALRERNRKYLGNLSGATGAKVTHVCASPSDNGAPKPGFSKTVIDGEAGCGNPDGCQTCLTAPVYQLGKPAERQSAGT
jgi:predicted 2-oxoglutarate/Fe(II)-dependent dioxygenase YbiX/peroxiredoxin